MEELNIDALKSEYEGKLLFRVNVCDEDYVVRAVYGKDIDDWRSSINQVDVDEDNFIEELRNFLVGKCLIWPKVENAIAFFDDKPAGVVHSLWQTLVDVSALHFLYQIPSPGDLEPLYDTLPQEEEPTLEVIEKLKSELKCPLYKVNLLWYTFLMRPMTVGDYKKFRGMDQDEEATKKIMSQIVVWAPSALKDAEGYLQLDADHLPAGIMEGLFNKCMEISGFQQAQVSRL